MGARKVMIPTLAIGGSDIKLAGFLGVVFLFIVVMVNQFTKNNP
jgi:hypothetical protein